MTLREHRKAKLVTAISLVLGGASLSAQANLTSSASLSFETGTRIVTSCSSGNFTGTSCTVGGAPYTSFEITDMGGSYFRFNAGNGNADKASISMFAPLHIGGIQESSGQHTGFNPNGSENPAIDNPWRYKGIGMHTLTSPISVISDFGSTKTLDFSGWGINWGNHGPGGASGPTIPLGGVATIVCSTSSCSDGSSYTLDLDAHIPAVFTSVPYSLHLEGTVNAPVPIPAAAWLFGSGMLGLTAIARRRKRIKPRQ